LFKEIQNIISNATETTNIYCFSYEYPESSELTQTNNWTLKTC